MPVFLFGKDNSLRRKDREVKDYQEIIKIIDACDCCRLGFVDDEERGETKAIRKYTNEELEDYMKKLLSDNDFYNKWKILGDKTALFQGRVEAFPDYW